MKRLITTMRVISIIISGLFILSGCGPLLKIEKDVPLSMLKMDKESHGTTGKTNIFIGENKYELYLSKNNIFILENVHDSDVAFLGLKCINNKIHGEDDWYDSCNYKYNRNGGVKGCLEKLITEHKLVKIAGDGKAKTIAQNEMSYIEFITQRDNDHNSHLNIEFIDKSEGMLRWKSKYNIIKKDRMEDYFIYAGEYPGSEHVEKVMSDMFTNFFNVEIVSKSESKQRSTQQKGLASSSRGTCKDISRIIKISPKQGKIISRDIISVKAKYVLRRTYTPYALEEKDDPLVTTRTYTLTKNNGFSVTDEVKYDCVLTSGRYHFAAFSFLGKILGKKSDETSITTELTNIGFDIDILDVK
ncbi:MAG: hypothetical protein ACYC6S_04225 [Desulfobulbia bacterium]